MTRPREDICTVFIVLCTLFTTSRSQKAYSHRSVNITAGKGNFTTTDCSGECVIFHINITTNSPDKVILLNFTKLESNLESNLESYSYYSQYENRDTVDLDSCDIFKFRDGCHRDTVRIKSYCWDDLLFDAVKPKDPVKFQSKSRCISITMKVKGESNDGFRVFYKEVEPVEDIFIWMEGNRDINAMDSLDVTQSTHRLNPDADDNITAIALNPLTRTLYIADVILASSTIKSYFIPAWDQKMVYMDSIITKDLLYVSSIVVDPVKGTLYWTDSGRNTISSSNADGSSRKDIISTNLQTPSSIVLDHRNQIFYWTCWGDMATVERAFVNGSDRRKILSQSDGPILIALGRYPGAKVRWINSNTMTLGEICVDECNEQDEPIYLPAVENSISLNIFGKYLYWTCSSSDWIYVAPEGKSQFWSIGPVNVTTQTLHYFSSEIPKDLYADLYPTKEILDGPTLLTLRSSFSYDVYDEHEFNKFHYIPISLCAVMVFVLLVIAGPSLLRSFCLTNHSSGICRLKLARRSAFSGTRGAEVNSISQCALHEVNDS